MTEPTKQQALALAIVKQMETDGFIFANPEQAACVALAAIMETTELAADMLGNGDHLYGWEWADKLRAGEHYAIEGDRHG